MASPPIVTALNIIVYPIATVLNWLLIAISALFHVLYYLGHAVLLPFRVLAKFETIFIYLGTAALVGVITSSIFHFAGTALITAFEVDSSSRGTGSETRAARVATRRSKPARRADRSKLMSNTIRSSVESSSKKDHMDRLDSGGGKRKGDLLSQTILEEDDDSDRIS